MIGVEQRIVSHSGPLLDCLRGHACIYQAPVPNVINHGWGAAIEEQAAALGAKVLLSGSQGNATLSFGSMTLLGEYLRRGRPLDYLRELRQFVRKRRMRWPNAIFWSVADLIPAGISDRLLHRPSQRAEDLFVRREWASRVAADRIGSGYRAPGVRVDQHEIG